MNHFAQLDGLVPDELRPRTRKIVLEDYSLDVDIGFHEFEVGRPQRLILTVEVWVDEISFPAEDDVRGIRLGKIRLDYGSRAQLRG